MGWDLLDRFSGALDEMVCEPHDSLVAEAITEHRMQIFPTSDVLVRSLPCILQRGDEFPA